MLTGLIGAGNEGARILNPNGKVALGNNFQLPLYGIILIAIALLIVVGLLIFLAVKVSKKRKRSKVAASDSKVWTRESETRNESKENVRDKKTVVTTDDEKNVKKNSLEETIVDNNYDDDSAYASREINEEKTKEEKEAYKNREMKQDKVRDEEEDMTFAQTVIIEPEQEEEEKVEEEPAPTEEDNEEQNISEEAKEDNEVTSEDREKREEEETVSENNEKDTESPKEETESKVTGKIEICNSYAGEYKYILKANNGQLLYESKSYKSIDSCKDAIENFIEAVDQGLFTVRDDKFKNYKFILKSPTSNTLIYVGESFSTEASCKNNIESVKRFAKISQIVDLTQQTAAPDYSFYEIPEELKTAVEEGELAPGKWVIEKVAPASKTSPFVFLLYANNGQLLYESRDYKTNSSCIGGIKTFVNAVRDGEYIVDPEKSGRFKFVLRSKTANTVEYYGQSYDTKKSCENSIESVYHFALSTPVPEK